MPFSHHSHSGEFCAHAHGTLEEMVQAAIAKKLEVFALTEHMPRDQASDLYPEEVRARGPRGAAQSEGMPPDRGGHHGGRSRADL